jgi:hypothetical protein
MKQAALIVALLIAAPVAAAEPTLGPGFADTVIRYTGPEGKVFDKPVDLITIGDFDVRLEVTNLTDVTSAFGGEIHHQGEAGEAVTWLCYTRDERVFWFYSDGEMGDGKVNMVAVEDAPGASTGAGCSEAHRAFDSIDFGIRTFGDWMGVMHRLGTVEPEGGLFGYRYMDEIPLDGKGTQYIAQELVYRVDGDHIGAVAVLQISEY